MTREEATKILRGRQRYCKVIADHANATVKTDELREGEAIETAISALTPPTQEQMERVWPGCDNCTAGDGECRVYCDKWGTDDYCGHCGRPLTPAAWEELRKRWEVLNDGKGD